MMLLLIAGIWDLERKEIPCFLLYGIAMAALLIFMDTSVWDQICSAVVIVSLGAAGWMLVKSGKIGGGDVWVLICFAVIWPMNVFWESLSNAVMVLGVVSVGIWAVTGDERLQIPMVPFLVLGYWM